MESTEDSERDERVETGGGEKDNDKKRKEEDTPNAGVREHFVNFVGGKTVIPNPTDVMHAENKILPLYEICRLFLGINRDTASAFASYCKMKAYYHKFQSTGMSERLLSILHVDEDDDDVTIYVKSAGHFYNTTSPVPDKRVEKSRSVVSKSGRSKKKTGGKAKRKTHSEIDWKSFDENRLKELGKKLAEHKTGYEFGPNYNFMGFFWEKDYNEIVKSALEVSTVDTKNLVPFKKLLADDGREGDETEAYSDSEK